MAFSLRVDFKDMASDNKQDDCVAALTALETQINGRIAFIRSGGTLDIPAFHGSKQQALDVVRLVFGAGYKIETSDESFTDGPDELQLAQAFGMEDSSNNGRQGRLITVSPSPL